MPELLLSGCACRPLASYLKACGVLRLLAGQKDDTLRGCWRDGVFLLQGDVNPDAVREFFLKDYKPTPLVTPWNGGSGFYDQNSTAGQRLRAITDSTIPRLAPYRDVISQIQSWPEFHSLVSGKVSKEDILKQKEKILQRCRSTLPEACLPWLDAAYALGEDKAFFAPLLGTGGNEGNLEYANTFMGYAA
uniref:type I-G CRISPR-associated protein Cas8g1/Csx17 n=1 Tax=uncultured Desulfovibrio sp. TaxID=167968 RepID=UPI00261B2EA5